MIKHWSGNDQALIRRWSSDKKMWKSSGHLSMCNNLMIQWLFDDRIDLKMTRLKETAIERQNTVNWWWLDRKDDFSGIAHRLWVTFEHRTFDKDRFWNPESSKNLISRLSATFSKHIFTYQAGDPSPWFIDTTLCRKSIFLRNVASLVACLPSLVSRPPRF